MKKFRLSRYGHGYEDVTADYYYLEDGFTHFVIYSQKREDRILSMPSDTIARIQYIGEHTESAPEVL